MTTSDDSTSTPDDAAQQENDAKQSDADKPDNDNLSSQQEGPFNTAGSKTYKNPDPDRAIVKEGAGEQAWENAKKVADEYAPKAADSTPGTNAGNEGTDSGVNPSTR